MYLKKTCPYSFCSLSLWLIYYFQSLFVSSSLASSYLYKGFFPVIINRYGYGYEESHATKIRTIIFIKESVNGIGLRENFSVQEFTYNLLFTYCGGYEFHIVFFFECWNQILMNSIVNSYEKCSILKCGFPLKVKNQSREIVDINRGLLICSLLTSDRGSTNDRWILSGSILVEMGGILLSAILIYLF